ncbi:conserved Plasmodium protein, unknown function [Plasmodium ovale]|uniref:Uncharacterized protein n=1 Tax=Plasmodium ovale TaxID=36330 RepID=A0A1C3KM82_PLAOA|nr:conserved Plasmodium protein, unknown function [Plasmodium ovale]
MIYFFNSSFKKNLIKRKKHYGAWTKERFLFSSKRVPIICVKTSKAVKQMIRYIENTYSNDKREKRDNLEKYFGKNDVTSFLCADSNYERMYNCWREFHFKKKGSDSKEDNVINTSDNPSCSISNNSNINNNDNSNDRHECLNSVFKLCSDEHDYMNIVKKNIIGIYVPIHKNIHSININYFYIFKNLKELMNGKLFYELYFFLPSCIFLFSFAQIFKELIYYKKIIEYAKMEKNRKVGAILQKKIKNSLLMKIYRQKEDTLKRELKNDLGKIFSRKYTKVIYEDSLELASFLHNFLKINSFNWIDLHHLYQYIIALYDLKILKHNIYGVIPILFPDLYNNTLVYACTKAGNVEIQHLKNKRQMDLPQNERRTCPSEILSEYTKLGVHTPPNGNEEESNFLHTKKNIMSVYNYNDDSNDLINFEKQLIHILYIFPCAHKLLIKYKDLEGYNICYKMNELIEKYRLMHIFKGNHLYKKSQKLRYTGKIKKWKDVSKTDNNEYHNDDGSNRLMNSLCSKLNINEEIIYNHQFIVGKNMYAYIYEKNKGTKNIIFHLNLNSKEVIFRNILSRKNCSIYDKKEKIYKYRHLLKNVNNCLFSNKSKVLHSRNRKVYNYKNNMLVGLLYDKENNFHYFDDKHVGDVVLCSICDISPCGKYLYLQRFDNKNLIFHFRKEKYINLEKNYDYDDITKIDEDRLKDIL